MQSFGSQLLVLLYEPTTWADSAIAELVAQLQRWREIEMQLVGFIAWSAVIIFVAWFVFRLVTGTFPVDACWRILSKIPVIQLGGHVLSTYRARRSTESVRVI